ncbi:MAG: urea carboxylase-associated family protein [Terrimicrobiaceae bacterium]|nr:urea carboxylase-associated family protein [Terrimicrobiaceae bacterium]
MSLYTKELTGAGMWSAVISRGKSLRLTALEDGANVGMLLYNASNLTERYNMPDTLKGQHIFRLAAPYCLHSDMGRIFCAITEDTVGWHDTVCGTSDADAVRERYGEKNFQVARNDFHRNGRDCFLIELAKWGLGKRDLMPNVNWFSKAVTDEAGKLTFVPNHSRAGDSVTLRFEIDTLVVLHTLQHPLDPDPTYHPRRVELDVFRSEPVTPDDPCRISRPENIRAYENTEAYNLLRQP